MEPSMSLKKFFQTLIDHDIERRQQTATELENEQLIFLKEWASSSVIDRLLESEEFECLTTSLVKRFVGEAYQDLLVGKKLRRPGDFDTIEVINLTPHEVNLYDERTDEMIAAIPKSDRVVRVTNTGTVVKRANLKLQNGSIIKNVPFVYNKRIAGDELPTQKPGTFYIVSALVLEVFPYREDLICVNTSNEKLGVLRLEGTIIGSRSLRPSPRGLYALLAV